MSCSMEILNFIEKCEHEKKWCKVVEDIDIATESCGEDLGWYHQIGKKITPNILPMSPFYHFYWQVTNTAEHECYILMADDIHDYDEHYDEVPYDTGGTWFNRGRLVSFRTASRLLPTPQQARDMYHYFT